MVALPAVWGALLAGAIILQPVPTRKGHRMTRRVWTCKLVVELDEMPLAFDGPPRRAVIDAVERHGAKVVACFSGWGGSVDAIEQAIIDDRV